MMEKPADILAHAERSRCLFEPGTSFQYSNNGVDFLAALAGKLAGKPMNVYLDEKLFRPLGIADIGWMLDDKGVPFGAGEMMIRPLDLAKVGAALATGGQWHGAPVVERSWIEQSSAVGSKLEPTYGLLWWRMAEVTAVGLTEDIVAGWRRAGAAETTLAKVASIVGRSFPSMSEYRAALHATLKPEELAALNTLLVTSDHLPYFRNFAVGPSSGIVAAGWLGQFLVVMPEKNLVGVRMRRLRESDQGAPGEVDGFRTFPTEVAKLVAAPQ
jgi:CubicO group peptidase (beta-lactamase class C family)